MILELHTVPSVDGLHVLNPYGGPLRSLCLDVRFGLESRKPYLIRARIPGPELPAWLRTALCPRCAILIEVELPRHVYAGVWP